MTRAKASKVAPTRAKSNKPVGKAAGRPHDFFHAFAQRTSSIVGSPWAFATAVLVIAAWAVLGPAFGYSDTWQLVINTGTTIVTFLIVFLIQNTQNRDARAIHLKLDELLRAVTGARTGFVDLEYLSEKELEELHKEFEELHAQYSEDLKGRMAEVQEKLGERRHKKGKAGS